MYRIATLTAALLTTPFLASADDKPMLIYDYDTPLLLYDYDTWGPPAELPCDGYFFHDNFGPQDQVCGPKSEWIRRTYRNFIHDNVLEVFESQDPNLPESIRYSEAVRVGDMLYLSGVTGTPVARDADDEALTANFVSIFEEVKTRLSRAGATFDNVITVETFRLDYAKNFALFNEVKNRYIRAPYPTWTDIGISALPPGAVAELVVTAWLGGTRQEAVERPAWLSR